MNIQTTQSYQGQAAEIYEVYPRKVAKPHAIRAIIKAIKKFTFATLMEKTTQYASCVKSWPKSDHQFIPYPATWFNREQFNDDQSTWVRMPKAAGVSQLKTQLEAIEKLILSHPANPESTSHNPRCNGIQKDELDDLKRKRLAAIRAIAHH